MSTRIEYVDKEIEEAVMLATTGKADSTALRAARQKADAIRAEMRKKYGNRDIAVRLVQQSRDAE